MSDRFDGAMSSFKVLGEQTLTSNGFTVQLFVEQPRSVSRPGKAYPASVEVLNLDHFRGG